MEKNIPSCREVFEQFSAQIIAIPGLRTIKNLAKLGIRSNALELLESSLTDWIHRRVEGDEAAASSEERAVIIGEIQQELKKIKNLIDISMSLWLGDTSLNTLDMITDLERTDTWRDKCEELSFPLEISGLRALLVEYAQKTNTHIPLEFTS